jgi:HAD superfamily hydrolase (TIGR01549 family)
MVPPLRAVLFDWDGTLLDSAESSYRCYVRLFGSFGMSFDRAAYERTYSPNWYRTYAAVGLPETAWAEADARWLGFYAEEASRLLPGAREALRAVAAHGLTIGLVTSGDRQRVARELVLHDLDRAFATVVCADDARMKKPHPEALLLALDRLGVESGGAVYVGDSPEDVEMARAARVRSVGVPGGFPNRDALEAARPDVWAESLGEAVAVLTGGTPSRTSR